MISFVQSLSSYAVPFVMFILCLCFAKNGNLYSSFVKGAREGLETIVGIIPTMTLLLVALSMFSSSGAADKIAEIIAPYSAKIGLPSGIIPLVVTRPLSGSAATAAYSAVLEKFGADSLEAFIASIIMGSGDTLVYVISVYYSATSVKKTRYVFPVAIFTSVVAVFIACILASIFY